LERGGGTKLLKKKNRLRNFEGGVILHSYGRMLSQKRGKKIHELRRGEVKGGGRTLGVWKNLVIGVEQTASRLRQLVGHLGR